MATALIRIRHCQHSCLHPCLRRNSIKYSNPDPFSSSKSSISNYQRNSWYSFSNSIPRKSKETEFPLRSIVSASSFSSRASSSHSGLLIWYLGIVKTRPVATKSITAAFIYTAADLSSQTIVGEATEKGYCWMRTVRMAGYGVVILGPSLHFWFNFMSRAFPNRDLLSTFKKIALGQTVFGPAMTSIFFSVNAALKGESGSEIASRLKRDLLPTMINGVMYWPFCDFVTFKFIPVHLQPLVSNSFSYLWTIYMTYMASLAKVGAS